MWQRRRKEEGAIESVMAGAKEPIIAPMSYGDLHECWRLDQRCFTDGEAYDRETFRYLLSHKQAVCSKVMTPAGEMVAFLVGMVEPDGTGHVVALAVSPEFRRRGYGRCLMMAVESSFYERGVRTVRLEVRTSNDAAQNLYFDMGYKIIRRMSHYYTNGDDGYMMVKTLL